MNYICFVPLIGGMALANEKATGEKPMYVLSYPGFAKNEQNLKDYWPDVKWYVLNSKTNRLDEPIYHGHVDFVSSVCPCAGMSGLNTATRGAYCPTNDWLYKTAEYTLSEIKPTVYWGENAPGLYSDQNSPVLNNLRKIGQQYGYAFTIYKTDSQLHGIPQRRVRTFFFFWKGNRCPIVEWINIKPQPFEEFILDKNTGEETWYAGGEVNPAERFPEMDWILQTRCGGDYLEYVKFFYNEIDKHSIRDPYGYITHYNLWDEYRNWLVMDERANRPVNKGGRQTPLYYVDYRKEKIMSGKGYFAQQPIVYKGVTSAIISKNMCSTLHPTEQRFLNTREIMSLMGLPNDFKLTSKNVQHITQNVPVNTAKTITDQVIKFINGELEMTNYVFIKQNNLNQKIELTEKAA